ncbi:polysaccharide biosynthesis/export family protein [Gilvibacter sp.]|uniref:polysaccharide biosynthesis/export family protein n=1 Tax=Gilvibacter sp. TaxID=2729997 RepID=UPI0025C082DB|nr:polysaccharide biosynthesis/export family protein [Gilvibacter sp.]NQX78331.1 polysaccharide biosynthesis/export family protein [Gilvibacter sp.]
MKYAVLYALVAVLLSFSSCIPTKRISYLQEDLAASNDSLIALRKVMPPYRVQVNDMLSIRIKALDQELVAMFNPVGESNLNATGEQRLYYDGFTVDQHGNIRVPTLGEVNVLGYTVEEIRETIEKRLLSDYFKEDANIFVTVKLAGIRYVINGEIGRPGSSVIYREQVSIMEAIATNGDIRITGDRTDVIIVRQYPQGQKVHHIDLTTIDAVNSPYYYIQPNDLILVNPLPQKSIGTGTTGLSSFTTILTVITGLTSIILLATRL